MGIKFNCSNSNCRQRIEVDEAMAGKPITCPGCSATLLVPASVNIKFNCTTPECEQHIVVDVSEAGRFVRCPSCGKPSQVPGAPPKPLAPAVSKSKNADDKVSAPPIDGRSNSGFPAFITAFASGLKERFPFLKNPIAERLGRLLAGWSLGAILFGSFLGVIYLRESMAVPPHFNEMADEIFHTRANVYDAPVENHDSSGLLYEQDL